MSKRILLLSALTWIILFPSCGNAVQTGTGQKKPAVVILTAGQSNTDGRVNNTELPEYIRRAGYTFCHWSYGSGTRSGHGEFTLFHPWIDGLSEHDKWAYDAVVYYRLEHLLKEKFYVIKESLGGTSIDTLCTSRYEMHWSADPAWLSRTAATDQGGKSLLKALTDNIGACIDKELSRLPEGYDIKVLLWHQGESDISRAERYYDNLKTLIAYVRRYLVEKTGNPKYAGLPVVCGTFAEQGRGYSPEIVEAMHRIAREDRNFYVVDAGDATLQSDNIHFDSKGAELLGNRVYETLIENRLIED